MISIAGLEARWHAQSCRLQDEPEPETCFSRKMSLLDLYEWVNRTLRQRDYGLLRALTFAPRAGAPVSTVMEAPSIVH